MAQNWRAPACYVGVGLLCMIYMWVVPGVGVQDVLAGAGLGAAMMWALNDWEIRHQAHEKAKAETNDALPEGSVRERAPVRASRVFSAAERPVDTRALKTRPSVEWESRRTALEAPARSSTPEDTSDFVPQRHRGQPVETPIEQWRREVRKRDIETMEKQLRAFAEEPREPDPAPYGAPERPRAVAQRREPERGPRPVTRTGRSYPR